MPTVLRHKEDSVDSTNDMETLKAMFDRAGIRHTSDQQTLTVESDGGDSPNGGYLGFYTTYNFDTTGMLVSVGAWE